jgi:cytochrome oxidase assembly protein ShyY1
VVIDRADLVASDINSLLFDLKNPNDPRLEEIEWRQATATGEYVPALQFTVINRSQNGRAGANLVTPLQIEDGRILLINRGFVPLGFDLPEAPSGSVEVRGLLRVSQERRTGQLSDPAEGRLAELQRLDIRRIAAQTPGTLLPMYLQLLTSDPPEIPGFPEPVIRPDLSEGSHLSYAVQWFIFATAVGAGWLLAVRRSILQRKKSPQSSHLEDPEQSDGSCDEQNRDENPVIADAASSVSPSSVTSESTRMHP